MERWQLRGIALVLVAAACGVEAPPPDGPSIDADGIGLARRGLTVGELRSALPPGTRLGALDQLFMVDISAVPVIAGSDTLYHLLFSSLDALDDSLRLEMVATLHPGARTADGLGPGVTLSEAVAIRGPVTLSYNVHDESREYATFEAQPENMGFRVRPPSDDGSFAGEYSTNAEHNTTTRYDPDARIWMVLVNLLVSP